MEGFQDFIGVNILDAVFVLLNTLLVLYLGKKFLFVPVKKMIDSRQKEIDDMYCAAQNSIDDAQAMKQDYEQKLAQASATSEEIVKAAVVRAQLREQEIISQANTQASAILDKAAADVEREKRNAANEMKDEISVVAVAIAEKVVAKNINGDDESRLISEFINQLGE
jgi:F-type H+-transporting ATPase subunit b